MASSTSSLLQREKVPSIVDNKPFEGLKETYDLKDPHSGEVLVSDESGARQFKGQVRTANTAWEKGHTADSSHRSHYTVPTLPSHCARSSPLGLTSEPPPRNRRIWTPLFRATLVVLGRIALVSHSRLLTSVSDYHHYSTRLRASRRTM